MEKSPNLKFWLKSKFESDNNLLQKFLSDISVGLLVQDMFLKHKNVRFISFVSGFVLFLTVLGNVLTGSYMSLFSVLFSLGVANFVVRYNLNNDTSIKAEREKIVVVYLKMGELELSRQVNEFDKSLVVLKNYFTGLLDLFDFLDMSKGMLKHKTIIGCSFHQEVRAKLLMWSQLGEIGVDDARDMLNDSEVFEVLKDKMLKAFSDRDFVKFYMEQSAMSFEETRKIGSRVSKKVLDNSNN